MSSTSPIGLEQVLEARERIAGQVLNTPCHESIALSDLTGCRVFSKLDFLQRTGSFKERGAANALMRLEAGQRERGVIAASAGNHALAMAYHGQLLGIPVTVVMPRFAPLIKIATCRRLGAEVVTEGGCFDDAKAIAYRMSEERGLTYVHGFDDPDVMAGQGTMGLELLEQVKGLDAVIVPVGGGGLIAGVATAVKALRPEVKVIGVEADRMPCFSMALEAGEPVDVEPKHTLADGLAVCRIGTNAFAASRDLVDRVVRVDESDLALAVLRVMELEKVVVEGAGAASLAALLSGQLPELQGQSVALPLCGGNIDPMKMQRVIEHGLASAGRLHPVNLTVSDLPGTLSRLTAVIAEAGASIQHIQHDRTFSGADLSQVGLRILLETQDHGHFERVKEALVKRGWDPRPGKPGRG